MHLISYFSNCIGVNFCVVTYIYIDCLKLFLSHPVAFNKCCRVVGLPRGNSRGLKSIVVRVHRSVRISQCKKTRDVHSICARGVQVPLAVCWPCTAQNRFSQCASSDGVATKTCGDRRSRSPYALVRSFVV